MSFRSKLGSLFGRNQTSSQPEDDYPPPANTAILNSTNTTLPTSPLSTHNTIESNIDTTQENRNTNTSQVYSAPQPPYTQENRNTNTSQVYSAPQSPYTRISSTPNAPSSISQNQPPAAPPRPGFSGSTLYPGPPSNNLLSNQNQTAQPQAMSAMQKLFGGGGGGGGGGLNQNQTDNINNQGLSQQPPLGNQQTSPPPIPTQNSNNFSQGIGNSFQQRNRSNPSFGNMPGASQGPPSSGLAPIQNLFGRTGGQQHQPLHDPHMRYKVRGNITNTLAMMDDEDLVNSNRQMKNWNPPSERMSRLMARPHEQNYNNNTSRLELEYPIENVYVGPDISPSVAIKVNEAVDKDRLGNHYHVQRFIYEPVRQQLTLGTGEHIQRRLIDHPNHTGERHMFESPHYNSNVLNSLANDEYYPGTHHKLRNKSRGFNHHFDIDNDLPLESYFTNPSLLIPNTNPVGQFIENLLRTPGTTICKPYNSFDLYNQFTQPTMYPNQIAFNNNLPVNHYVADALPNDPMRNF